MWDDLVSVPHMCEVLVPILLTDEELVPKSSHLREIGNILRM